MNNQWGEFLTVAIEDTPESKATKSILQNHLLAFQQNDLKGVMNDYTNQSVFITEEQTYVGTAQIETFFSGLLVHFPKDDIHFDLDKLVIRDEFAFIIWHATTPTLEVSFGTDTFLLKDGKIFRLTFAAVSAFL